MKRRSIVTNFALAALMIVAGWSVAAQPPKEMTVKVKDKEGKEYEFKMVLIPGGKFKMGSPEGEEGRKKHEGPQHEVEINPFYLATTEVTFDIFLAYYNETVTEKKGTDAAAEAKKTAAQAKKKGVNCISGPTPLYGDPTLGWGAGKRPAIGLTWHNAMTFCKWLSSKTGKKFRLPTEAEWEYACRAGTTTPYSFGDNPDDLEDYGWYEDNSDEMTHEVAQKKPNPWGLYDMHGNVMEWVLDFYSPDAYATDAKKGVVRDPKGPEKGKVHVARGGAWNSPLEDCRSAARAFEEPFWRYEDPQEPKSKWWLPKMGFIGFRVACEAD